MKDGTHLSPPDRAALLALMAGRERLSHRQLARLFAARTGVAISHPAVARARKVGYRRDARRAHLDPDSAALRDGLVRGLAGLVPWAEIARRYEAATGRPIDPGGIARRARALGLAPAVSQLGKSHR